MTKIKEESLRLNIIINGDKARKQMAEYEKGLDVLRNCVGYANGRFAEIQGLNMIKYQLVCNAEQFMIKANDYGLTIGTTPKLGSIMVWSQGSTSTGNDGAGHVAIVEKINDDGSIITSESGWNAKKAFWTQTRTNANGRWGQSGSYKFLGFIYNPAVEDPEPAPEPVRTYTVKKGDSLWAIAKKYLGTGWAYTEIKTLNGLKNNNIYPGQKLNIPMK